MIRITFAAIAAFSLALSCASAASVNFYQLPPNAYPHDVAPAVDGAVWYSGQRLGVLGRFDPKSGKAEHIPLGQGSAPHGVIVGPDGAPWLTDGGLNAMVRVDPATRVVKVFPLPKEFLGANLNTAVFDKRGVLWFTGQTGVYGRVNPAIGKVETWNAPKGYGAYGITVTPSGQIWYCSLASDYIAQVDLTTGASTVVEPPRRGAGPRRIWSDSKGMLWASFWNGGGIGRYDPANKKWTVYPMPSSTAGTYSVYVDDKDRVWATDWPANAIQRFDPTTEKFETFPSDKARAQVRQMLGRSGEAWGGESGTDRLVVVRD
jgi:virginiamycin B lyase